MITNNKNETWTVYVHVFPNGKLYVGITSQPVKKRWGKNGSNYRQQYLYKAIEKYGWGNIYHQIVASGVTEQEAKNFEILLIKKLRTTEKEYGYNITFGGEGLNGWGMSEEQKEIINASRKRGVDHPFYGKTLSEETKRKMSEAHKGRTIPEYVMQSLRDGYMRYVQYMRENGEASSISGMNGKHHSADTIEKIKIAKSHISDETRKKMSEARMGYGMKSVRCVETGQVFKSVKDAAQYVDRTPSVLTNVLKGRRNKCAGYHWEYVNN